MIHWSCQSVSTEGTGKVTKLGSGRRGGGHAHLALSHSQLTRQLQNVTSELLTLLLDLGRDSSCLGAVIADKPLVLVESLVRSNDEFVCYPTPTNRVTIFLARSPSVGRNGRVPDVDPRTVGRDSCGGRWQAGEELTHRLIELSCAGYTFVPVVSLFMLFPVLSYIETIRLLV